MQTLGRSNRARRVVGQQRRDFQRYPPVNAVGAVVDGPEQIGGPREILKCQLEEQILARFTLVELFADRYIVGGAVFDRVIEDRRI